MYCEGRVCFRESCSLLAPGENIKRLAMTREPATLAAEQNHSEAMVEQCFGSPAREGVGHGRGLSTTKRILELTSLISFGATGLTDVSRTTGEAQKCDTPP